jgi:hypothetical protein
VASGLVSVEVKVLGYTSATWTVHADGVDFIKESNGSVLFSKVADSLDGGDTAAHGVDRLESDNLGSFLGNLLELGLKIDEIVVLPNDLLGLGVRNTLNHRGVVGGIGEDDATRKLGTKGSEASVVGDVARRKDKGCLLAVKGGELVL